MFLTLINIQRGDVVHLQQCINNHDRNLRIGLRSLTYIVGWSCHVQQWHFWISVPNVDKSGKLGYFPSIRDGK